MKPRKNVCTASCEKQVFSGEARTKKMVNNTPFYNRFEDGCIAQTQY